MPVTAPSAARYRSPRPGVHVVGEHPVLHPRAGIEQEVEPLAHGELAERLRCRSTNCSPPMPSARSRRAARSPTSGPQSCTFPPPADFARCSATSRLRVLRTTPVGRDGARGYARPPDGAHVAGRVALVTGVSRRGGIGFAIARAPARRRRVGLRPLLGAARRRAPVGRRPRRRRRASSPRSAPTDRVGHSSADLADPDAPAALVARRDRAVRRARRRSSPTTPAARTQSLEDADRRRARRGVGGERARLAAARPGVRRRARRHPARRPRRALHLGPAPRADGRRAALRGEQGRDPPDDAQPRRPPRRPRHHGELREPRPDRHRLGDSPSSPTRSRASMPFGRWGAPADAANLVAFLVSDEGAWITGQVHRLRGRLPPRRDDVDNGRARPVGSSRVERRWP